MIKNTLPHSPMINEWSVNTEKYREFSSSLLHYLLIYDYQNTVFGEREINISHNQEINCFRCLVNLYNRKGHIVRYETDLFVCMERFGIDPLDLTWVCSV